MTERIRALFHRMAASDAGDPDLIQHFTKVHAYAALIAAGEGLDPHTAEVLEAAALVHDIAIPLCNRKYGRHPGHLQELEGPPLARAMLSELPFTEEEIVRVCRLVGEHHTLSPVDGIDHRILLEADFLVNGFENSFTREECGHMLDTVFATETGRKLCAQMFGLGPAPAGTRPE